MADSALESALPAAILIKLHLLLHRLRHRRRLRLSHHRGVSEGDEQTVVLNEKKIFQVSVVFYRFVNLFLDDFPRDTLEHLWHQLIFSILEVGKTHQCTKFAVFGIFLTIEIKYVTQRIMLQEEINVDKVLFCSPTLCCVDFHSGNISWRCKSNVAINNRLVNPRIATVVNEVHLYFVKRVDSDTLAVFDNM